MDFKPLNKMPPSVTVKSYLPQEKKERSKLQQIKDKHRSFTQTSNEGIPKDFKELKSIKLREHGLTFLNQYMNLDKKVSKTKYCKTNHISHNSLNTGLKLLGCKSSVKRGPLRPVETIPDQSRPVKTKKKVGKTKTEATEIKAGEPFEDEEINEMINDSLANLRIHT
jgi:hypothetical protein